MRFVFFLLAFTLSQITSWGQTKMDKTIKKLNKESVPYIYTEDLSMKDTLLLLDTREQEEFQVSHLKNALWVGYKHFNEKEIQTQIPDKTTPIVVYCSIGVRSEDIGEKLLTLGYKNVQNLYGGIFEWKNKDGKVYSQNSKETDSVHAFNKYWGKLLLKGEKVYTKEK